MDPIREHIQTLLNVTLPDEQGPYFNWQFHQGVENFRVSGLSATFKTPKGELLIAAQGEHPSDQDFRVVKYDDGVLMYRLCAAMEGSDYEAFIVGSYHFTLNEKDLEDTAKHLVNKVKGITTRG